MLRVECYVLGKKVTNMFKFLVDSNKQRVLKYDSLIQFSLLNSTL